MERKANTVVTKETDYYYYENEDDQGKETTTKEDNTYYYYYYEEDEDTDKEEVTSQDSQGGADSDENGDSTNGVNSPEISEGTTSTTTTTEEDTEYYYYYEEDEDSSTENTNGVTSSEEIQNGNEETTITATDENGETANKETNEVTEEGTEYYYYYEEDEGNGDGDGEDGEQISEQSSEETTNSKEVSESEEGQEYEYYYEYYEENIDGETQSKDIADVDEDGEQNDENISAENSSTILDGENSSIDVEYERKCQNYLEVNDIHVSDISFTFAADIVSQNHDDVIKETREKLLDTLADHTLICRRRSLRNISRTLRDHHPGLFQIRLLEDDNLRHISDCKSQSEVYRCSIYKGTIRLASSKEISQKVEIETLEHIMNFMNGVQNLDTNVQSSFYLGPDIPLLSTTKVTNVDHISIVASIVFLVTYLGYAVHKSRVSRARRDALMFDFA